jgi:hypothetical protein
LRQYLITTFHCADCGNKLEVTYLDRAKIKQVDLNRNDDAATDITGASKVMNQVIVKPCPRCKREALEPLEHLQKALELAQKK